MQPRRDRVPFVPQGRQDDEKQKPQNFAKTAKLCATNAKGASSRRIPKRPHVSSQKARTLPASAQAGPVHFVQGRRELQAFDGHGDGFSAADAEGVDADSFLLVLQGA